MFILGAIYILANNPILSLLLIAGYVIFKWVGRSHDAGVRQAEYMKKQLELEAMRNKAFEAISKNLVEMIEVLRDKSKDGAVLSPAMNTFEQIARLAENNSGGS